MEKRRCIFCMEETDAGEKRCPFCKKALWEYQWEERWLKPYTVLKNRYMVGVALGEGAFGVTYLAYDEEEKCTVAVKVYPDGDFSEESTVLKKAADIPGIVRWKDSFLENGKVCLVMEYLDGGSLKEYLKKHRQIPAERAEEILVPVMEALMHLHSRGILHGDISPDNLLFDKNGSLKLIDFGAALQKGKTRREKKLKEGYAPVEQYQDKEKIGPWSDIYALCAVWYEMVTGHKVPSAPERAKKDSLKEPGDYVKVPEKMEQVFMRGLSVDIQGRYFSMENLLSGLALAEKYTADIAENTRKLWGDLWIAITTEVERRSASDKKRGRFRKHVKTAAGILLGFGTALALAAAGLWIYCDTHPEKVLEYWINRDREEAESFEAEKIWNQDTEEFQKAVEYLKTNSYEADENTSISTYRITADALKDWKYPSGNAGRFPIKADTAKRAADLFTGQNGKEEKRSFNGYVEVYHDDELDPLSIHLEWTDFCYYGEDRLWIESDYVTDYVESVMFLSADSGRAAEFLYKMIPVVSPEAFLTEEEIMELLETAKREGEYISVNLNAKCQISMNLDYEGNFSVSINVA